MLEMLGRAKTAEARGQATQSEIFFQICGGLGKVIVGHAGNQASAEPKIATPAYNPLPPSHPIQPLPALPSRPTDSTPSGFLAIPGINIPTPIPSAPTKTRSYDEMIGASRQTGASAVLFDNDTIPTNDDLGLTPFFQQNLVEFRAPLPLTIFNEEWQGKAILYSAEKRVKSESGDKDRYTGYPYPSEYTQTYQEWSVNHQGFLAADRKIPTHANLAAWLVSHKQNTDGIIQREGFMTALRYDIHVRTNALTHRVPMPNGSLSVANISVFRREIALTAHAKAVRFGEAEYEDNPYAPGGCRFGWDPTTGQLPAKKDKQHGRTPLHLQQPMTRTSMNHLKPGPETPKGPSGAKDHQARQGGHKGARWGAGGGDRDTGGAPWGNNGVGANGGGSGSGGAGKGKNH